MTNAASVFDLTAIRAALQQTGLAPSEIAFRVDIAVRSLQRILDGDPDPGEIRVATLTRLADTLGLPLRSMFAAPRAAPEACRAVASDRPQDDHTADDASTVIAVLYDRETAASNSDIALALGWPLDRLNSALHVANERLGTAGLRIVREHGESRVSPIADHLASRASLATAQAHARGLKTTEYKAAYALHTGQKVTTANETRQRFVIGRLANVGVVHLEGSRPRLSDAARFAHP
ncbi:hypothetical protein [Blastococcus sp. TF02A-30]|uniref:hypothetical protein n=1 Tax=Blastococcus sp. TF02A-30 TaxID=2250580 RepID=UPI000DE8EE8F|nr:hypothetical protein [Blastococcus sp. TF02A-30]RBY92675.1 hypothetical protein DQ241_00935 [Blastococcus sp. TF02A-30]